MLIRFAKRRANWETPLTTEKMRAEFKAKDGSNDHNASVYLLDQESELGRACAEHSVYFEPDKTATAADLAAAVDTVKDTDGNPRFAFVKARHRELALKNDVEFDAFIAKLVSTDVPTFKIARATWEEYVAERLRQRDPEWREAAESSLAKRWLLKLAARVATTDE